MIESKERLEGTKGLPSATVPGIVFFLLAVAVPMTFSHRLLNADGDVARHLVLGRHVMEHGVVFPDPFSHTRAGETFVAYEWLAEVVLASAEGVAGLPGVVGLAALLIATSMLLVALVLRHRIEPLYSIPAVFGVAVLTGPHWIARPHLFTFVCLSLLLYLVSWRQRETADRRLSPISTAVGLLVLFALFALWANLHPGFLYGVVILAAFLTGAVLDRTWTPSQAVVTLGAAVAGTLLNPLGVNLHTSILHHLEDRRAFALVQEFDPLSITSGYGSIFLLSVAMVSVLLVRRRRICWAALLPFIAAATATFAAQRNGPLFALFALPLALESVADQLQGWKTPRIAEFRARLSDDDRRGSTAIWVAVGVVAIGSFTLATSMRPSLYPPASRFSPDVFPVEAVGVAHREMLDDRTMFNSYDWGGYLLYAWPEQRIFIDGMANFFGSALMDEYVDILTAQEGWEDQVRARGVDLILVPPAAPVVRESQESGEWRVVYQDETSSLIVRRARHTSTR